MSNKANNNFFTSLLFSAVCLSAFYTMLSKYIFLNQPQRENLQIISTNGAYEVALIKIKLKNVAHLLPKW